MSLLGWLLWDYPIHQPHHQRVFRLVLSGVYSFIIRLCMDCWRGLKLRIIWHLRCSFCQMMRTNQLLFSWLWGRLIQFRHWLRSMGSHRVRHLLGREASFWVVLVCLQVIRSSPILRKNENAYSFLSTDISTRSWMHINIKVISGSACILTDKTTFIRLLHSLLKHTSLLPKFSTHINIRSNCSHSESYNQSSFNL